MHAALMAVALSTLGVDFGYKPTDEAGGYEYTLAIKPEELDSLGRGELEINSTVPSWLKIRSFKIFLSHGEKLPQERSQFVAAPPVAAPPVAAQAAPAPKEPAPPENSFANHEPPNHAAWPENKNTPDDRRLDARDELERKKEAIAEHKPPGRFNPDKNFSDPLNKLSSYRSDEDDPPGKRELDLPPKSGTKTPDSHARPKTQDTEADTAKDEPHSWLLFSATLFLLAISVGGNVYLGWTVWTQRSRYFEMLTRFRAAPEA